MARLAQLWKPFLTVSLVFLVFACSGGGCGGCEGCGISPIPGAFPLDARIPNAAQIRLSSSGITFIEDNIDGVVASFLAGGLDFAIPRTATTVDAGIGDVDVDVCPSGDCSAHIEIDDLTLTPTAPNRLHAEIRAMVDTRDATGARRAIPVHMDGSGLLFWLDTTCQADIDTRRVDPPYVGLIADIEFIGETEPARAGYTRINVVNPRLDPTLT